MTFWNFKDFHDVNNELAEAINERDKQKPSSSEKNKEVEHLYVDFTHMVISEKLRNMSGYKSKDDVPSFDGNFYSSWIV